jgi:hypothetical protein
MPSPIDADVKNLISQNQQFHFKNIFIRVHARPHVRLKIQNEVAPSYAAFVVGQTPVIKPGGHFSYNNRKSDNWITARLSIGGADQPQHAAVTDGGRLDGSFTLIGCPLGERALKAYPVRRKT